MPEPTTVCYGQRTLNFWRDRWIRKINKKCRNNALGVFCGQDEPEGCKTQHRHYSYLIFNNKNVLMTWGIFLVKIILFNHTKHFKLINVHFSINMEVVKQCSCNMKFLLVEISYFTNFDKLELVVFVKYCDKFQYFV